MEYVLKGQTALLTGASGFIGSRVARRLTEIGVRVVATHRGTTLDGLGVEWVRCDLDDFDQVRLLVRGVKPDVIMHLAGRAAAARDTELIQATFTSNLTSTVTLLNAAIHAGVPKTVLAGSSEEPEGLEIPSSPYAASKWAATGYARMAHALFGLNVSVARIFMTYGPGEREVRKLIPYVIQCLLRGETPEIGSGTRPIDWVFIGDVAEGLIRIAGSDRTPGKQVDLGSGEALTVRDLVRMIVNLMPGGPEPRFGAIEDRAMEQIRVANLAETRGLLDWQPDTDLRAGLQETIDWYRDRTHVQA